MEINNPQDATQFLRESVQAAEPVRQCMGRQIGLNRCMFVGRHWITDEMMSSIFNTTGRHLVNINPDTNKLRLVLNRIPRFIHETAAASFPSSMNFDVSPSERDMGSESAFRARVLNSALSSFVRSSGFLASSRDASYRRCIDGLHGIGLCVRMEQRRVGKASVADCIAKTFTFDAHRLVLDPFNQSLDLWDHEYVIYRDVWTATKIKRELGIELDPDKTKSIGELMPFEMVMNTVSMGRLYPYVKEYSTTKGAYIVQMHVKGDAGNFPTMLVGVDYGGGDDVEWQNFDNQDTPFGGNGLPFMLLHGYREPETMVSRSDVSLLKHDQDQINLLSTMAARVLQRYSGPQWTVAVGSMDGDGVDDYKSYFTNNVGGVIPYKPGTRDRPMQPPQLITPPAPQPYLQDVISLHQERDMPSQIHRPPITVGATKTHVPDQTFQSALQQAGQVLGTRIAEDTERYQVFATMMLGTLVKQIQAESPTALATLRRDRFDSEDYAILMDTDPAYPACEITLKESSIKYRSTEQKEAKLNDAAKLQMISPEEYRKAQADLDAPITEEDRIYDTQAKKWAARIVRGEDWMPRSLGPATTFYLTEFRKSMNELDPANPEELAAFHRLDIAVQSMLAFTNMELMEQTMAQQPPTAPAAQPQQQAEQQQMPKEASIVDILNQISNGGGSGSSSQPVAA